MIKVLQNIRVIEQGTFITGPATGMLLGNVDSFRARPVPPCLQYVAPKGWLATALRLSCEFPNRAYTLALSPELIFQGMKAGGVLKSLKATAERNRDERLNGMAPSAPSPRPRPPAALR